MAGSPKGMVEGEVVKVVGRVKVERCIEVHPPKAGAKAQRAKLRGDRYLKESRNLRRKKGGPQGSHLKCKGNGGEVGRPG